MTLTISVHMHSAPRRGNQRQFKFNLRYFSLYVCVEIIMRERHSALSQRQQKGKQRALKIPFSLNYVVRHWTQLPKWRGELARAQLPIGLRPDTYSDKHRAIEVWGGGRWGGGGGGRREEGRRRGDKRRRMGSELSSWIVSVKSKYQLSGWNYELQYNLFGYIKAFHTNLLASSTARQCI